MISALYYREALYFDWSTQWLSVLDRSMTNIGTTKSL